MAKLPKRPKKQPTGDYPVGYGRPPKHSQVKPGQALNPFGRNGKPKSEPDDAFEKARTRLSRVTIDGEVIVMPSDEAFYLRQMALALAGDKSAARIIAQELGARRRLGPAPFSAEDAAQAEAEEAQKRLLAAKLVTMLDDLASAKREGAQRMTWRDETLVPWEPEAPPEPEFGSDGVPD